MTKKLLLLVIAVGTAFTTLFYSMPTPIAHSQGEMEVQCGQIVEAEFTDNMQEHIYLLDRAARESFEVSVEPFGDFLNTVIVIYGPSGLLIDYTDNEDAINWAGVAKLPAITSGILSARGQYKIRVANTPILNDKLVDDQRYFGGVGLYTLSISCSNSDGRKIKPGDISQPTPTPAPLPTLTPRSASLDSAPDFSGVGFPGLAPVDFSSVAKIPLLPDTTMTGVIPTGNEILGFTLDAKAGDTLDLSYTRASGNMNLGLVVLSEKNEVFFQASLVTSEALSTRFTLPTAGKYTIGIFRIRLVEPAKVEPTVFQLQGVLKLVK